METYNKVIKEYESGTPIKVVAKILGVSEVKVRRILITEGLWSSPTSDEIKELFDQGLSASSIAEKLQKPLKTVQAYMPYSRGEYGGDIISNQAQWSKDYRERNRKAAAKQVFRRKEEDMSRIEEWKKMAGYTGDGHKLMKLRLELLLDLDDEEMQVLRKYGRVKEGITRDFIVSADMPLHNLHFAINKAFGWTNSHLHHFAYMDEVFKRLCENRLTSWLDLCGVYFRFPQEELDDLYWDDDYDESISPNTWMRRKYTLPYEYGGFVEHYMYAQTDAKVFYRDNPVMRVGPSFDEYMKGNKESKTKGIDDMGIDELGPYFRSGIYELLERLPIGQVIDIAEKPDAFEKAYEIAHNADASFEEYYLKLKQAEEDELSWYTIKRIYKEADPEVIPLSDNLIYSYDYGDGWNVEITCMETYQSFDGWYQPSPSGYVVPPITKEEVFNSQRIVDSHGNEIEGTLRDQIATVMMKGRPVCIAADGLPVLDDVGGTFGYCCFLKGIHGQGDGTFDYDDKESTREWGRSQGWTGRMSKPENIL